MSSLVTVANRALDRLKYDDHIVSLDEPSSAARSVNLHLIPTIRTVLDRYMFQEAVRTETLLRKSFDSEKNISRFDLPADTIRVLPLEEFPNTVHSQNYLVVPTSEEKIDVNIIFENTNPQSWSVGLHDCVVLLLASTLASSLLGNHALSNSLLEQYHYLSLPLAIASDGRRHGQQKRQRISHYMKSRNGSGPFQ